MSEPCPADAKSAVNVCRCGGKKESASEMRELLSLLRAVVEQNEQLISMVMQQGSDDVDQQTGFGLDGLMIGVR